MTFVIYVFCTCFLQCHQFILQIMPCHSICVLQMKCRKVSVHLCEIWYEIYRYESWDFFLKRCFVTHLHALQNVHQLDGKIIEEQIMFQGAHQVIQVNYGQILPSSYRCYTTFKRDKESIFFPNFEHSYCFKFLHMQTIIFIHREIIGKHYHTIL